MKAPPGNQSSSRVLELDGLRGTAILVVVLYHYLSHIGAEGNAFDTLIEKTVSLGWTGVDLFFVLSGFLIGGILMDHRSSGNYFSTFYVRRVCRIMPVYFFSIGLFFVLGWLLSSWASSWWYSAHLAPLPHCPKWSYLIFLQNYWMAKLCTTAPHWTGVTWSLCIEEQFYMLVPLLIWLVPPRRLAPLLAVLILATVLGRCFCCLYYPLWFLYVLTPCRADALLIGVLCACLMRNPRFADLFRRRCDWLYLIFVLLFCGMLYFTFSSKDSDFNSFDICTWGYTWIALFYATLLLIVVTDKAGLPARVMRSPLLGHFAVISYCVYLIHLQIHEGLFDLLTKSGHMAKNLFTTVLSMSLGLPATWLLAIGSRKYLEKPIIDWGHSFRYSNPKKLRRAPEEFTIP